MHGLIFNSFELGDGTTMYFEIAAQQIRNSIGSPVYDDIASIWTGAVATGACPLTGWPRPENKQPDLGALGLAACSFEFVNEIVYTDPSTLATFTMVEWLQQVSIERYRWHVRFYHVDLLSVTRLAYWGILEQASPSGDLPLPEDATTWKFSLTSSAALSIFDTSTMLLYDPSSWVAFNVKFLNCDVTNKHIGLSEYDHTANANGINEYEVQGIHLDEMGIQIADTAARFVRLKDILYFCSYMLGCNGFINQVAGVETDIECSTRYTSFIAPNWAVPATGSEIDFTWDDLYVPWGLDEWLNSTTRLEYGIFHWGSEGITSLRRAGTWMEILKFILVPFGLTAEIRTETHSATDYVFLWISEIGKSTTHDVEDRMLQPVTLENAERAYGLSVAIANDRQVNIGENNDRAMDMPWMGTNRIVAWDAEWGRTKRVFDRTCLMQSVFVLYDSTRYPSGGDDRFHSVGKVKLKNGGAGGITVTVNHDGQGTWNADLSSKYGEAALWAWACAYYHFSLLEETSTNAVGIMRPITTTVNYALAGIDFTIKPGDIAQNVIGFTGDFRIRETAHNTEESKTELVTVRGAFA